MRRHRLARVRSARYSWLAEAVVIGDEGEGSFVGVGE